MAIVIVTMGLESHARTMLLGHRLTDSKKQVFLGWTSRSYIVKDCAK